MLHDRYNSHSITCLAVIWQGISSRSHAYSTNNRYYAPCERSSINFNKITRPYIAQVFEYICECVRKDRKICRTRSSPMAGRTMDKRARRGEPICFYRSFVSLFGFAVPPPPRSVPSFRSRRFVYRGAASRKAR